MAIVFLSAGAASAVTFDYSVTTSQVVVGSDTILAYDSGPQTITLTPNVAATPPINLGEALINSDTLPYSLLPAWVRAHDH